MQLEEILTVSNILFVLTLLGVIFSIYKSYRKPQEKIEREQALNEERDKSKATVLAQKEVEGKANILAQQVQWEKESNEKKFTEFGIRLDNSLAMAQNHIHTIDVKVDGLTEQTNVMSNKITELSTIINERIPKKI
jgi:hypothetical protein